MFLTGLGVFTASSFASAIAGTAGALFAARAGQGLGAAMLSPAALAIIMSAFQGSQRAKALAAWGQSEAQAPRSASSSAASSPSSADWRMIFYVNLPVAARSRSPRSRSSPPTRGSHAGGARPPRRPARNHEPRRDRLRHHPGRKRRLDFCPDAPASVSAASPASLPSRPSSAAPTHRSSASSGWSIALSAAASS